ncbi:hypothetical protein [Streptomyces sp. URMC 124]|uniref:hypothetical protein n=1 Tax=Streptomyces sp. URMC 124 TaxID=3423405 RepID=UPI003F1C467B
MSPADRLLDVLNGWLAVTSSSGPVAGRLELVTPEGAALFAKLSLGQVERLGHLLAVDESVLRARAETRPPHLN